MISKSQGIRAKTIKIKDTCLEINNPPKVKNKTREQAKSTKTRGPK